MTASTSGTTRQALPPTRTSTDHPLRRARRRRRMTLAELAGLTDVSISYISMIERGQRSLTRLNHITAMATALRVAPAELAPGASPAHPSQHPSPAPAVPAPPNQAAITWHARLTREFLAHTARGDTRAAGIWLRRTARDPNVSPWLLLDLLATHHARTPASTVTASTPQPEPPAARTEHPLRRLRRSRGMTQAQLAIQTGLSAAYISMIERGQRTLTRLDHITAIAAALNAFPAELAPPASPAHPRLRAAAAPAPASAFPSLRNDATTSRHTRLTQELLAHSARGDTHATRTWLRRTARDPNVSPWLLLDLLATHHARTPHPPPTTTRPPAHR